MILNIIYGTIAVCVAVGLVVIPIWARRQQRDAQAYWEALNKHNIVYCVPCAEYKVGKYSLCQECIKKFATESKS